MKTLNTKKIDLAQKILVFSAAFMLNGVVQLPASADVTSPALFNQIRVVMQYSINKNYPQVVSAADALLANNPQNSDLHYMKGDALKALGNNQAAAIEYRTVLALHPAQAVADWCNQQLASLPGGGIAYAPAPMPAPGTSAYNAAP